MTTAGLEFAGRVLRYTEVERTGPEFRLLRLGNCDFEFDAESDLFGPDEPRHLATIAEAVADVFSGTTAQTFRFTLPSRVLTSFPSAVSADADQSAKNAALGAETELLGHSRGGGDAFPVEARTRDDGIMEVHVDRADAWVRDRLGRVKERLSTGQVAIVPARTAVVHLFRRIAESGQDTSLLIGCGADDTDFVLLGGADRIRDARYELTAPADRTYFALETLQIAGVPVAEVDAVYCYGPSASGDVLDALRSVFGSRVARLDPGKVVGVTPDQFESGFRIEAFAPCVGAAVS